MGRYGLVVSPTAKKHIQQHRKSGNRVTMERIERILEELQEHPTTGFASPEPLKGNLSGFWSRQINKKDRIIYTINDETVIVYVISAKGHYGDK